jgi:hypothetical protein
VVTLSSTPVILSSEHQSTGVVYGAEMAERLDVHQPGDRFATLDRKGKARIYQVDANGIPKLVELPPLVLPVRR